MNTETKRHIDAARQVLVGVVPNPTSQIDQITNALIYKFMDDMDQAAIKAGGDPSFFVGDLQDYAWTRLMDSRVGNQERMNIYSEALVKFSQSKQLPQLFRDIFKSAFLPYRSPEVLGLFLKEISYFDYSHPEDLGDAYEYLLSIMSSQGDAGQFRTPRHIIDFIVDVVNPTKDDKVLDPACGTGGFLVSAYKQILEHHDGKDDPDKKEKPLTPDQRKNLMNNFEGYDVDPGMVRIAQVNMYLHQFKNPKIVQYDTLSMEERWADKFDVILANPPFMSPRGGVQPHNKFSVQSSRSEVLFVDYIMNHLRPKGRAGIIVPEGIIFQLGGAHKQLRKNLVEDGLYAVVSLPQGIFNPYAGVKTSILLFDNEIVKKNSDILFVKIQYDGTDLGAKKRITVENDLPKAIKVIEEFRNGIFKSSDIAHAVDRQTILSSGDYNLSGDRYKISTEIQSEYSLIDLGELIVEQSERVRDSKNIEVWSISNKDGFVLSSEYFDKQVASSNISNYKIIKPGYFAYNPSRINVGSLAFNNTNKVGAVSPMYVVFSIKETVNLLPEYLFSLLKSDKLNEFILQLAQGAVRQQLRFNDLKIIKIPFPPLNIQKQIVDELDSYLKIISGARHIIKSWKPSFILDANWDKLKLVEVVDFQEGPGIMAVDFKRDGIPLIRLKGLLDNFVSLNGCNYLDKSKVEKKWNHFKLELGDLLLSTSGSLGKVSEVGPESVGCIAYTGIIRFRPKNKKMNHRFVKYFLMSDSFVSQALAASTGVTLKHFGPTHLKEMFISVPPIEIQEQIVEKIESESVLVDGNKKLMEIYEQKMKDVISKLWKQ
jgi:type I restriction enzyme M protein